MNVTITTDGGFTGRGLGNASADSDDDPRVRRALENARPEEWRDEYRSHGADLIGYTLTIEGGRSTSWQTGAELPKDLEELFDAVWAHRT